MPMQKTANPIKRKYGAIHWVSKTVKLNLEKHYMSDQLNRSINDSPEETSEKATN